MSCDEQLWHIPQTTASDPKHMIDRYQKKRGGSYADPHKNP